MPEHSRLIASLPKRFHFLKRKISPKLLILATIVLSLLVLLSTSAFAWWQVKISEQDMQAVLSQKEDLQLRLTAVEAELTVLQNQDQKLRNDELEQQLKDLQSTYTKALAAYERLLSLEEKNMRTEPLQKEWASLLTTLSKADYATASEQLASLEKNLSTEEQKIIQTAAVNIPTAEVSNNAPASGYSRQQVQTQVGNFVVSLIAADLGSTRVIVDTASDSSCGNDCPVLSLGDYVSRNGGFAGINGTYFCPASYPSCAGKTNSFDLLVMNKNKVYLNSDNNVYSNNPAVIFGGGYIRFVGAASEWGRDTGVDGVLSNYPLLVSGGQNRFGGDGDPKKEGKSNRSFVANKGNTVYIGVVHGASAAEAAWTLTTLGMDNALNLDSGGSTALWSGGYKVGPGRNIPNAIVFVRK